MVELLSYNSIQEYYLSWYSYEVLVSIVYTIIIGVNYPALVYDIFFASLLYLIVVKIKFGYPDAILTFFDLGILFITPFIISFI